MTSVLIRVESGSEAETRALYRALRGDLDLAQAVELSIHEHPSADDELGSATDAVLAIVNGATALGALIVSISTWRDSRSTKWTVSFERDGLRMELRGSSREELNEIIRTLEELPRGGA